MDGIEQTNGNPQVQQMRNTFNDKVSKLSVLGKTKKVLWSNRRRWRNI